MDMGGRKRGAEDTELTNKKKRALCTILAVDLLFSYNDDSDEELETLHEHYKHDLQDMFDGTARAGVTLPWEERFWERKARHLDSRTFSTMFRCM